MNPSPLGPMLAILLATAMAVAVSGQGQAEEPTTVEPDTTDESETTTEEPDTPDVNGAKWDPTKQPRMGRYFDDNWIKWDTLKNGKSSRPGVFSTLEQESLAQKYLNDARYGFNWGYDGPICADGGGGCLFLYTLDFSKESKNCERKLVAKGRGWGKLWLEPKQSCSHLNTLQPSEECEKIREKVEEAHECMAM